ncbi:methyltransferase domain-containing protein [Maricaulis sp. D1M11]|uniref:class I SAM-dependent methyltransferase n=1 Tax=Maricaulis sp. D1M11 TaxID=3076117 RepID=UPI0039B48E31
MKLFFQGLKARFRDPRQFSVPKMARHCPICGYEGVFHALGTPPRWDGRCPSCGSRERHRLIHLWLEREGLDLKDGRTILHFAPEKYFIRQMDGASEYHTADIVPGKARHAMDMADMTFENASVDVLISNHVLEHVPDHHKAMDEIARVLKPGGFALLTVPQNWAREETYENPELSTDPERYAHYNDVHHLRFYGRDFPDLVAAHGLDVSGWRLPPEEEPRYGLCRDDVLWIARKPAG